MKPLLIFLLVLIACINASQCHHSCKTCSGSYYTQCVTCSNPTLKVNFGTACSNQQQQDILVKKGGTCGGYPFSNANPLGIIFLLAAAVSFIIKSHHALFFVISFQTLSLLGFTQTNLAANIDFFIESLQYFMTFSVIQRNLKPPNCKLMLKSMYRVNIFFRTPDLKENLLPILSLAIVASSLLLFISIMLKHKRKKMQFLTEATWDKIKNFLKMFIYLTMQEQIVIIYVGIRFSALDEGIIVSITIYCMCLVYLIVSCNIEKRLSFFVSTASMNLSFTKRLVLPLIVSIPYNYTYFIIVLMIAFNLIELMLLFMTKKVITKHAIYLGLELQCISMVGAVTIADLANNSQNQTSTMSIIATLSFVIYFLAFSLQILLVIRKRLKEGKVDNAQLETKQISSIHLKSSPSREQDTISDINNNQKQRQTKVTPAEPAPRKVSDDLKVTKRRLQEVRVQQM